MKRPVLLVVHAIVASVLALLVSQSIAAAPLPPQTGGAVIVRVVDIPDVRCINTQKDRIWLTLRRAL